MKTNLLICFLLTVVLSACVQKSYKKTVVYTLHLTNPKAAMNVGVRGNDKPLSWQADLVMQPVGSDSTTYRVVVTYLTGYTFTEAKFVVNNGFELAGQPNRRVVFSPADTTFYEATFERTSQSK